MVQIKNAGPNEFINYIQDKKVYFFGAGALSENCVDIYCANKKIEAIIDNKEKLWGTKKKYDNQEIKIINVETFVNRVRLDGVKDTVLLIVPNVFTIEIIEQLNSFPQLDGLECYIHACIRNTREPVMEYCFTTGALRIPPKIHYVWFGGAPIPDNLKKCIDSWKKFNPEYEIIRWDETNYDFSKNQYMLQAYKNKAWGFASDYARLDIVYQYGGIYLDTDVEILKKIDVLLCDGAFFGMGSADRINLGVGFGAIPRNPFIKELRDYYDGKDFINEDGRLNRMACYYYQHPIFKKHGFQIKCEYQKLGDIVVYPPDVLSPKGTDGFGDFFSDKTLAIHHGEGSWSTERERAKRQMLIEMFSGLIYKNRKL